MIMLMMLTKATMTVLATTACTALRCFCWLLNAAQSELTDFNRAQEHYEEHEEFLLTLLEKAIRNKARPADKSSGSSEEPPEDNFNLQPLFENLNRTLLIHFAHAL